MAFAYEQATHPRRPPPATPALVNGQAPSARTFIVNLGGAHVTFTFDPIAGTLAWDATRSGRSSRPCTADVRARRWRR